jgi:peptidyl-prolyl cis-trans isomerase D
VRKRILDGQDFAEVAKELSEDLSAEQGGDLGWFKPGEMVPAFEETAFQLKPGEVSEVVESPFGLHLILVEDRKEAIERSLEEVREEVIATLAEQRAESDLDEALTRIEGVIARQALSELASEYGGELRQSELFSRESVIPGIGSAFGLIGQLDGKQAGDSGVWKRNPVQGHVVWKISAVAEPAPLPLEQAKDRVLETVRQQQALEYALQQAQQALGQVQGGASLEEIAKALELEIQPMEFAIGTRFLPELGDNSEFRKQALQLSSESPWALSENGRRVDLMHFEKRWLDEADLDARQAQIRNSLLRLQQQTLLEKEIKRLRETASIEVISPLLQLPGA